ncbi:MAG: hypothetical protein IJE17_03005 [Clostridia bacterium]|nr:hypothetical protein [Clostridia bacterium]
MLELVASNIPDAHIVQCISANAALQTQSREIRSRPKTNSFFFMGAPSFIINWAEKQISAARSRKYRERIAPVFPKGQIFALPDPMGHHPVHPSPFFTCRKNIPYFILLRKKFFIKKATVSGGLFLLLQHGKNSFHGRNGVFLGVEGR